ncbi:MAG: hypothetical protein K0S01_4047 [Herbinix sp.]|jgi:hypothetical protein|nr:hypothetical protein [Herbinix sp.]
MATVQDYYYNATHIIIRDDSCCKPEEVDKILKRISEQASIALYTGEINKEDNEK